MSRVTNTSVESKERSGNNQIIMYYYIHVSVYDIAGQYRRAFRISSTLTGECHLWAGLKRGKLYRFFVKADLYNTIHRTIKAFVPSFLKISLPFFE